MRTTMLPTTVRRSFAHGQLSSRTARPFQTFARRSFPSKYDQDKDSLRPASNEYSKSGDDSAAAATEKAAFDPSTTSPEEEHAAAREESGGSDSNNPLNVSPANTDISKPRGQQEGGAQGSAGETGESSNRSRTSGGGSPSKTGGGKSGGGSVSNA